MEERENVSKKDKNVYLDHSRGSIVQGKVLETSDSGIQVCQLP